MVAQYSILPVIDGIQRALEGCTSTLNGMFKAFDCQAQDEASLTNTDGIGMFIPGYQFAYGSIEIVAMKSSPELANVHVGLSPRMSDKSADPKRRLQLKAPPSSP
jgi:hypothetical protein